MSNIKKFDYSEPKKAKPNYNDEPNDIILSDEINTELDNVDYDDNDNDNENQNEETDTNKNVTLKELISYEKKYKKLKNFGMEKIYIPLSAIVIIGSKTLFPNCWGISVALIGLIYFITKIVVEYKLEQYVEILGYTPELEPSKIGKLVKKLKGDS